MTRPQGNDKLRRSLENKIAYRESYLDDKRRRIRSEYDRRVPKPDVTPDNVKEHWAKKRDTDLEWVDKLDTNWVEPLRAEYRQLMGLD